MRADPDGAFLFRARQVDRGQQRAPELADVERPSVAKHQPERVELEADALDRRGPRAQNRADEKPEILAALPQRGNPQAEQAEPREQVLAKPSLGDEIMEAPVGRRHHAHVHGDLPLAPQRPDLMVLEDAQQLDLKTQRHLPDLVEEQRASLGGADQPLPLALGAREGSADVAEQLVLEQALRQGRAVDAHQRAGPPRTVVEEAGQHLLAHAGFAFDQHLVGGPREPRRLRQLELPLGAQGGRILGAGAGLHRGFREAGRRTAEEKVGVADLDQVAVA